MAQKLIIFIKNPVLGNVKTRIAKSVGDKEALKIYEQLIETSIDLLTKINTETLVYFSSEIDENILSVIPNSQGEKQVNGNLGTKMSDAFQRSLNTDDQVILMGSDCPYISAELLQKAFSLLDNHDVVLGPTFDGGYYLIGLNQLHSLLFKNIDWSTDKVLNQTIERAATLNLKVGKLPILNDIDHIEDWQEYLEWQDKSKT